MKPNKQELELIVGHASNAHPLGMLANIIFIGVLGAALFGLLFKGKGMIGVALFVVAGFACRQLIFFLLKLHLKKKYWSE